jgi:hypothetical protein
MLYNNRDLLLYKERDLWCLTFDNYEYIYVITHLQLDTTNLFLYINTTLLDELVSDASVYFYARESRDCIDYATSTLLDSFENDPQPSKFSLNLGNGLKTQHFQLAVKPSKWEVTTHYTAKRPNHLHTYYWANPGASKGTSCPLRYWKKNFWLLDKERDLP